MRKCQLHETAPPHPPPPQSPRTHSLVSPLKFSPETRADWYLLIVSLWNKRRHIHPCNTHKHIMNTSTAWLFTSGCWWLPVPELVSASLNVKVLPWTERKKHPHDYQNSCHIRQTSSGPLWQLTGRSTAALMTTNQQQQEEEKEKETESNIRLTQNTWGWGILSRCICCQGLWTS